MSYVPIKKANVQSCLAVVGHFALDGSKDGCPPPKYITFKPLNWQRHNFIS